MLSDWKEEYKNDRDVVMRIEKYQESYRYAMEIDEFLETTEISLDELRRDVPGFVAPQMYIYLDGTQLLRYLEKTLEIKGNKIVNKFDGNMSHCICKY